MRALKIVAIVLAIYAGIVIIFESLLGYFQPANEATLVIATTDSSGQSNDRVLARLEHEGSVYVAANHWPRAWYRQALANPQVTATFGGETRPYTAVSLESSEHDAVDQAHSLGLVFRILTGFPPRYILRLDPR